MNGHFSRVARLLGLSVIAWLEFGEPRTAAAAGSPVTQAWAARIQGPPYTFIEPGAMTLGPAGDVFTASVWSSPGSTYDILVSRHDTGGNLRWQQRYESADTSSWNEFVAAIVAQGTNVYVAGAITGTNGTYDILTLKYRDTGELEWARRFDGAGHSTDWAAALAIDAAGHVLVAGDSVSVGGTIDFVVLKYGPSGNLLWTYLYDGPGQSWDRLAGMRLDAAGHVHLAGTSADANGKPSVATLKLDPDGQELWVARERSGHVAGATAVSMDLDSAGNVVTAGTERFACVAWKYDANGNREWLARYRAEEPASMQAARVRFDGGGNVIMAANLFGSGTNDAMLVKYSPDGEQLWASRIADPNGVSHVQAFDVDAAGNAYLTVTPADAAVTVKVGSDGTQLWSATYDSAEFYDSGRCLEVDSSGNVFLGARSYSSFVNQVFTSLVKYTQQPVAGLPIATVTPAIQVVDPGTNIVFTAQATGAGPTQFQWRMNGRVISRATNSTLALTNVQVVHRGDYSVVVSNAAGTTLSAEARLSVRTLPEVVIAPTHTVAYVGTETAFIATVGGNDFVELQWRHNGTNIPGATNEILRLESLTADASGAYAIIATTVGGSTTSSVAALRISRAVELLRATPQRSYFTALQYGPQLHVQPNGDSIILGRTHDPATGSTLLLRKLNATGTLLWSASILAAGVTNAEPAGLAADSAGNLYVIGISGEPYANTALIAAKYSADGQLLWLRTLGETNQLGVTTASLAVDPEGNSTIGALGCYGTTLIRYSSVGEVLWSNFDPSRDTDTLAVAVDASGNSYLGTTIRVENDNEVRLRKINSMGHTVWTRPFAEGLYNRLGAIAVDPSGNLIAVGTGALDGFPDGRMFVLKYSPSGERLWGTRTGGDWPDLSYVPAMAVGVSGDITVLTASDDDAEPEHSSVIRITADGQVRYRIMETQIIVSCSSQLALDSFGNAYITGYGGRPATGADVVTAKYDSSGNRPWLVYHGGAGMNWEYGLAVGADAAGDIRVLAYTGTFPDSSVELSLLHYRQRDPASTFRVHLNPDANGTFHLSTPTTESFHIEASTDLQQWTPLTASETQQWLQPGGATFSGAPQRFFRLVGAE